MVKILKTKTLHKKPKVNIITLGCSKNLVDSETMLTQIKGNGMKVTHESVQDNSDIVIINTCGFIEKAKQESIDTILRYVEAKKDGLVKQVYVSGCLSQRYREELSANIKGVDAWFGTDELALMLKKLNADYKKELLGERVITTSKHYAYLKISEGCDRPCSFCAIPLMRGKHRSKPMEEILKEAESLTQKGVKEILLIAQDSTYYGLDLYKKRSLATLLIKLSEIKGLAWIRLHYAFPTGFPEDVLDVMASYPKVCNYLDIPLQHASSSVLKLMRRGTTREKTEKLLSLIRKKVPNIAIRTTLITGHPQETEKDFEEMVDFVKAQRFNRLGVFTYSHEESTYAFQWKDNVPQKIKEKRAETIMEIQEGISLENNQKLIGKTLKVLIDRHEGDNFIGRTEYDSPEVDNEVIVSSPRKILKIGSFEQIKIIDASTFDLFGKPC